MLSYRYIYISNFYTNFCFIGHIYVYFSIIYDIVHRFTKKDQKERARSAYKIFFIHFSIQYN